MWMLSKIEALGIRIEHCSSLQVAAQAFMRKDTEEELREKWVAGRQDARAAFKKRHADSARQQRLRARGAGAGAKKGPRGGGE